MRSVLCIFLFSVFLVPNFAFANYLAGRIFFEAYGEYNTGKFKELNNLMEELKNHPTVASYFEGDVKDFKQGRGLGVGLGYGITHYMTIGLRYEQVKFKSYNRKTYSYNSDYDVEGNLNYKLTGQSVSLHMVSYALNSPTIGLGLGLSGGVLFDAKFSEKQYFTFNSKTDDTQILLIDNSVTYKLDKAIPIGSVYAHLDIGLGILTSLIIQGGYKYAVIKKVVHESNKESLKNSAGTDVKIDMRGYFGSAALRFLF